MTPIDRARVETIEMLRAARRDGDGLLIAIAQ